MGGGDNIQSLVSESNPYAWYGVNVVQVAKCRIRVTRESWVRPAASTASMAFFDGIEMG